MQLDCPIGYSYDMTMKRCISYEQPTCEPFGCSEVVATVAPRVVDRCHSHDCSFVDKVRPTSLCPSDFMLTEIEDNFPAVCVKKVPQHKNPKAVHLCPENYETQDDLCIRKVFGEKRVFCSEGFHLSSDHCVQYLDKAGPELESLEELYCASGFELNLDTKGCERVLSTRRLPDGVSPTFCNHDADCQFSVEPVFSCIYGRDSASNCISEDNVVATKHCPSGYTLVGSRCVIVVDL